MPYMPKSAEPYMPKSAEPLTEVKAHSRKRPSSVSERNAALDAQAQAMAPLTGGVGLRLSPELLGAIGGTVGTEWGGPTSPAAVGLAGLGGGLGSAMEQGQGALLGFPMEGVGDIGGDAAEQAGLQATGGILTKGAGLMGKFGMNMALRFTPEAAQVALKEGITATGQGLRKLLSRVTETSKAEQQIVKQAAGHGIGWRDPVSIARQTFQEVASTLEGAPRDELRKLGTLYNKFLDDNKQDINPVNLLKKRQYYDKMAASSHKAIKGGQKVVEDVSDAWNRAMANNVRKALQTDIPAIKDPTVYEKITGKATTPAELQKLAESVRQVVGQGPAMRRIAKRLALPATTTTIGAGQAAARGQDWKVGAMEGAVAGAALDPAIMSFLGFHAQNPFLGLLLQNLVKGGAATVQSASE